MQKKILIIDDDLSIRETLVNYFSKKKYITNSASDGKEGLELLSSFNPDIIISDIRMPRLTGLELLEKASELGTNAKIILMTAFGDMQTIVEAMQKGAFDYLEKPLEINKLNEIVEKIVENASIEKESNNSFNESTQYIKNMIIGNTPKMKNIYKKIGQISNSRVTTLLYGESGTGKELIAKTIHSSGITRGKPFVAVNCSALSENLLESELFGHVKGAFTGSIRDKKGKFEQAEEGTIFFDEIAEVSQAIQVKLLRVLQEREFERVGGEEAISTNARVIAASNKKLIDMVQEGTFREDLFYRLSVVNIELPSLRERKDDIPLLVDFLVKKANKELNKNVKIIPDNTLNKLCEYSWPGNVRELENIIMQGVVLATSQILELDNIIFKNNASTDKKTKDSWSRSLVDVEKEHITMVLNHTNWNKPEAAKILGISLPTLYSKIDNYKILNE